MYGARSAIASCVAEPGRSRRGRRRNRAVCEIATSTTRCGPSRSSPRGCCATTRSAGAELEFDLDEGAARGGPTLYHYRPLTGEVHRRALASAARPAHVRARGRAARAAAPPPTCASTACAAPRPSPRCRPCSSGCTRTSPTSPSPRSASSASTRRSSARSTRRAQAGHRARAGARSDPGRVRPGRCSATGMSLVRGERDGRSRRGRCGDDADGGQANALLMLDARRGARRPARRPTRRASASARLLHRAAAVEARRDRSRRAGVEATGDGRWQPFELEPTGVARGEPWILVEGEEVELIEFLARDRRVHRRRPGGVGAARFEMGCRPRPGGRGAVGLPAGAAGADRRRDARASPCAWRSCARRSASASRCSGGWSLPRRSSGS